MKKYLSQFVRTVKYEIYETEERIRGMMKFKSN